jgi:flavin-dependent dehydrogenase
MRPLVIDRKCFPRDKPCAGWITPEVVQALALDPEEYAKDQTWQCITGFRCGVIGGPVVQLDYRSPVSYGIRRVEFDRYLLDRSGADRQLNQSVESIRREGLTWVINDRYTAPMLVGAGGTHCPVARSLGIKRTSPYATVVAQEAEFRGLPEELERSPGEVPALYFCRDLLGYGWCFRKGNYLNIGLGRTEAKDFTRHVAEFQGFLAARGIDSRKEGRAWRGHSYQLYKGHDHPLYADGALLLGDAAGLAYAHSGEGILPAVESGRIAAELVQQAHGDYRAGNLAGYQSRLQQRLGKPERNGLVQWLPPSWLACLASRLIANPWFSRRVVMDRWFLHRAG